MNRSKSIPRFLALAVWALLAIPSRAIHAQTAEDRALVKQPRLRIGLLERMDTDQQARRALVGWINRQAILGFEKLGDSEKARFERAALRVKRIDERNLRWFKRVVKRYGWPTRSMVDEDGAQAAWLLAQHADADPGFQKECLRRMESLPRAEVSQANIAYLKDRVLLAEGKKQIYGTQFTGSGGELRPQPIEDEANVDKRRLEVGLPPLSEYAKILRNQYRSAPSH